MKPTASLSLSGSPMSVKGKPSVSVAPPRASASASKPSTAAPKAAKAPAPSSLAKGLGGKAVASTKGGAKPMSSVPVKPLAAASSAASPAPSASSSSAAPPPPSALAAESAAVATTAAAAVNPHAGPGRVQVLYNHYKEWLPTLDGCLAALEIDKLYCFHAAFKGSFRLHLLAFTPGSKAEGPRAEESTAAQPLEQPPAEEEGSSEEGSEPLAPGVHRGPYSCGSTVFTGLPHGAVYKVVVEDDPLYAPKGPPQGIQFLSAATEGFVARSGGGLGSRGVQDLTNELRSLSVEQLSGEKYKAILEAREVEMALFSGGGCT